MAMDKLRGTGSGNEYGELAVTGSIVFFADDEVFSNQYWTLERAQ